MTTAPGAAFVAALGGRCGQVHLPGTRGYDVGRSAWNTSVDQRPAAVAEPATAAEVSALVRAAAETGLRVAAQTTGHNAGPLGSLDGVVLVRLTALADVAVDPEARVARVGGGARWHDVVEAAGAHDLAALHGSAPDVGVTGYSLGGGLGWYARQHGLQANSVTAVELVLADGSHARADADSHPALFHALRGGSGNFGVVTALEFRLYPIATAYAGLLVWDVGRAEPVLRRWARWAVEAPWAATTAFRVVDLPDAPHVPAPARGRRLAVVDGAVLAPDDEAVRILAGLRELRPELDTFGRVPATALARLHLDPEGPTPIALDTATLHTFPDDAIEAFLAHTADGSATSLAFAELRQLGGAVATAPEGAGAMPTIDGQFIALAAGLAPTPQHKAHVWSDAAALIRALAPWDTGRRYLNFVDRPVDARVGHDPGSWPQLKAVRSTADPDALFHASHPIPRAYEGGAPTP